MTPKKGMRQTCKCIRVSVSFGFPARNIELATRHRETKYGQLELEEVWRGGSERKLMYDQRAPVHCSDSRQTYHEAKTEDMT